MLLYPTFIPNQNNYNMLGIKLGIKIKNFKFFIRLVNTLKEIHESVVYHMEPEHYEDCEIDFNLYDDVFI